VKAGSSAPSASRRVRPFADANHDLTVPHIGRRHEGPDKSALSKSG
jgi:hypothetical protein